MFTYRDVHHLQPEGVADQVVGEHCSALQPRVRPSVPVRICNVQLRDSNGVDLVCRLGDGAFHRLLVLVRENRRHGGGFRGLELRMVKNAVRAAVGLGRVELSGGSCVARAVGSACSSCSQGRLRREGRWCETRGLAGRAETCHLCRAADAMLVKGDVSGMAPRLQPDRVEP
jgi:hypothetical protein